MKLSRLFDLIQHALLSEGKRAADIEVVIDTELPYATVGQRPCTAVKSAGMGFDWEAGQFRIEPEDRLMAIEDAVPQMVADWSGVYCCPKCDHVLSKGKRKIGVRYCSQCGQAVKWE